MRKIVKRLSLGVLLGCTIATLSSQAASPTKNVEFVLTVSADTNASPERQKNIHRNAKEIISDRLSEKGHRFSIERHDDMRLIVRVNDTADKFLPEIRSDITIWGPFQFRLVHPDRSNQSKAEPVPNGYDEMFLDYDGRHGISRERLLVKQAPELTGGIVAKADYVKNPDGRIHILLELTAAGSHQFQKLSRRIVQSSQVTGAVGRLAIVAENRLIAAPVISQEISHDTLMITGSFDEREALGLCNMLSSPIDFSVRIITERNF